MGPYVKERLMNDVTKGLVIVITVALAGCAHIPQHTFHAIPVDVPVPAIQSTGTLTVQNADLRPLESAVTSNVPPVVAQQRVPGGCLNPCYRFDRQSATLLLQSGKFLLKGGYRGFVDAKPDPLLGILNVECRLDPILLAAAVTARPQIKKEGQDWFIAATDTHLSLERQPGSDTHCVVGNIFDASGPIDQKLADLRSGLADTIAAKKFPLPIKDLDARLLGPVELPLSNDEHLCLYPRVTGITIGQLSGLPKRCVGRPFCNAQAILGEEESLQSVTIPFLFAAAPTLLVSKSVCPAGGPAPGLVQLNSEPQPAPFRILASSAIEYTALSDLAFQQIKQTQGRRGPLGRHFRPTTVQIGDASGNVFAQVEITGSLNGTVFFWGKPTLSSDHKTAFLDDFHLAAESKTVLAGVDVRLPDVIVNLFQKPLEQALTINVDSAVGSLTSVGQRGMPFQGGVLRLGNFDITVVDVRSTRSDLQIDAVLSGTATGDLNSQP